MIGVTKEIIGQIPSLMIVDTSKVNEKLPAVCYMHGFTSAKEHNLDLAYLLAEKGFRVILPDSLHHGERDTGLTPVKRSLAFWEIVIENIKDIQLIKDFLVEKELLLDNRIGVAGTSMGGITTSAALTQYPWIKTSAILMGSPKISSFAKALVDNYRKMIDLPISDDMLEQLYDQLKSLDLSSQIEKLNDRPLLFWHGENDTVVPFDHSYSFYEEAKKLYKDKNNIQYIREPKRDHKVSRPAKLETVKWFEKHL
ncbi:alpha/beta fold hydrolase [Oceanobacillus halophilus]|uniref:Alpha/beta fold hydrolase n=1 Tax=Oceanobacillus halophilus TaxID=930130 RepID=A0A494ZZZ8_9BACI|nr:alpha/beta fold hydrolase [Oceanobacillus halophilus]RKQ32612.1 alpha/beta fold hydrolase [Oceanobacillus halophilus]